MYIAIKTNETNMSNQFFRKTRNRKLTICNGKLVIMYLYISKYTYSDAYSNQDEKKKKKPRKANLLKNLDVVVMKK